MLLELKALRRMLTVSDGSPRRILDGIDLSVDKGEVVALVGRSGAGKTTLLHLMAGLDQPDEGMVLIDGQPLALLAPAALARLRRRRMGLVFQNNLSLSALPVWENAALPLLLEGASRRDAREQARAWLERVGLGGYEKASTAALSGGQRRRLGLARALIARPALLLADEPTSDLDETTAAQIEALLFSSLREINAAAVIVTHAESIERAAGRVVRLADGKLIANKPLRAYLPDKP